MRIEHDTRSYSILAVETQGIRREGDRIHPNYSGWIQNLQKQISLEPVVPGGRQARTRSTSQSTSAPPSQEPSGSAR